MPSNQEDHPPTKVPYPIGASHGEEASLHVWGNTQASRLVICCPGFPDDQSSMAALARRLADNDCFVGVMCLPGYDNQNQNEDGYSFEDWVVAVRGAIQCLLKQSASTSTSLTGIFHDWGVLAGLLYHDHNLNDAKAQLQQLDKIVLLDVMPKPSTHTILSQELDKTHHDKEVARTERFLHIYQLALATNFWLWQNVPTFLIFFCQYITEATLTFFHCFPVSADDYNYLRHQSGVLPVTLSNCLSLGYKTYPYRNIRRRNRTIFDLVSLPTKIDNILFLYGGSKWIPAHHPTSLQLLQSLGRAHCIPEAGHWLHCTHLDQCWPIIRDFVITNNKKVQ